MKTNTKTNNKNNKNKRNKVPTVTIDVKKWGRDYNYNEKTGRRCALGFTREQLGETKACSLPNAVIDANDTLKGQKRRETLRKLFNDVGIRLVFKNTNKFKLPTKKG